mmetsp:Transcript_26325/g.73573  ORF Transcript_26325/g.73573 Transcript_26325/m.73573 type:complete len:516 (+) Transcript_26325:196-1743(+)
MASVTAAKMMSHRYKSNNYERDEKYIGSQEVEAFGLDALLISHKHSTICRSRSLAYRNLLLHAIENDWDFFLKKPNDPESGDEMSDPEELLSPPSSEDDYGSSDSDVEFEDDEELDELHETLDALRSGLKGHEDIPPCDSPKSYAPSGTFCLAEWEKTHQECQFSTARLRKLLKERMRTLGAFTPDQDSVRTSFIAVQGKRSYMEDQVRVIEYPGELLGEKGLDGVRYYGVYDGHGGASAAKYVLRRLHFCLLRETSFGKCQGVLTSEMEEKIMSLVSECFKNIDSEYNEIAEKCKWKSGTTAIVTIVVGSRLVSACVGDSRTVLYRAGVPKVITKSHNPSDEDEKERVKDAGGVVVFFAGTWRVNGVIGVSRSIGDPPFRDMLIPDPSVQFEDFGDNDFVVMASDGLWDVVKDAEVPGLLRAARQRGMQRARTLAKYEKRLKVKKDEAGEAGTSQPAEPEVDFAKVLAKEAMKRGSRDNISVIVTFASASLSPLPCSTKTTTESPATDKGPSSS